MSDTRESIVPASAKPLPTGTPLGQRKGLFGVSDDGDTTGFGGLTRQVNMPAAASRPYGRWFDQVVDILEELAGAEGLAARDVITQVVVDHDELTIFIERAHILKVCQWMRDDQDLRFELCLGVDGVHYPHDEGAELHATYTLMSLTHNRVVRLEVTCPDADPTIPSVVSIYPGNDWWERETWDLMGIVFTGHPALTRTAMPDDWVGHPQRKDYPLGGIPVQYKGATVPPADSRRSYSA